jgi:hypothetical protein
MKLILTVLFAFSGTVAISNTAIAQSMQVATAEALYPSQSELLTTQPLTVREVPISSPAALYDDAKLKGVATSIQTGTGKSANPSFTEWIYTSPNRSSDTDPLGFFQVPAPARSVGVNIKN